MPHRLKILTRGGAIIAVEHFILGRPLDESLQSFSEMTRRVFKRRFSSSFPFISRLAEYALSYLTDGLYSASTADAVLKAWGQNRKILDCSYATSTGTKVGLPVATVSKHPSCRFFTNYNGVGERDSDEGNTVPAGCISFSNWHVDQAVIKPTDGHGDVPLWEM